MYPKYGKALSFALSALVATASIPTPVIAQELGEVAGQEVAAEAPDTAAEVSFVLHPTGEEAWNVADTLEMLLEHERENKQIHEYGHKGTAEVGFDGMMLSVAGITGVRYRLRDANGFSMRWATDRKVASVRGAATGVQIDLGETKDELVCYLAAQLLDKEKQTLRWTPWVAGESGSSVEAREGEIVVALDVRVLGAADPVPEPKEGTDAKETEIKAADATESVAVAENASGTESLQTQSETAAVNESDAVGANDGQVRLGVTAGEENMVAPAPVPAPAPASAPPVDTNALAPAPEALVAQEEVAPEAVFAGQAPADASQAAPAPQTVYANPISAQVSGWARLGGADRFETAALITQTGFAASNYAVLTTGRNFPDALSAVSLAGRLKCPVLICERDGLPSSTVSEIMRLGTKEIYVVGGSSAVSDYVLQDLELEGVTTHRVNGVDRMDTSLSVFKELQTHGPVGTVIIAAGQSFADALSIAPWAYKTASPILLTDATGHLTNAQVEALAEAGVPNATIVGGPAAVSQDVENQLSFMNVGRISGQNRYQTSAEIARFEAGSGHTWTVPYVATGKGFPDTLTGSALVGSTNSILVLADSPTQETLTMLSEHEAEIEHGVILGGREAVPFDDPLAVHEEAATSGKVGYQNPEGFYQVSSNNVTITDAARPPFDYITPSRIAPDATREDCVNAFIERATEYLGTPYMWDYACAPGVGVDCIGLVFQCAYACGMDLGGGTGESDFNPWAHYSSGPTGWHSHDSNNFWDYGSAMHVPLSDRRPGDLINYPGHTAIYLGDDQIIHAYTDVGVVYAGMYDPGTPRGCIRLFQ